jgi:hypothetical protein
MFATHSIGTDTMITSIRLKNLRRGIQDAGYMDLARAVNAAQTEAIVRKVIPKALAETSSGQPSWGERGKPFYDARIELLALLPKDEPAPGPPLGEEPTNTPGGGGSDDSSGCGCRTVARDGIAGSAGLALGFGFVALALARRRRRSAVDGGRDEA